MLTRHASVEGELEKENHGPPPALHLPPGRLFFGYTVVPLKADQPKDEVRFVGEGQTLRKKKK
jgi:ubiquitin fusion degradation protein 1